MRTILIVLTLATPTFGQDPVYVRKATKPETLKATLEANRLPTLTGTWHWVGPFDNTANVGFLRGYPPEKKVDLNETFRGKDGKDIAWNEFKEFKTGEIVNLARFPNDQDSCVYLYHRVDVKTPVDLPLSLGSDDMITVWLNGKRLLNLDVVRPAGPDQDEVTLKLTPGVNELLIKVCNLGGEFAVYVQPGLPKSLPASVRKQLERDYPSTGGPNSSLIAAEARHYEIVTLPVPEDIVMEVGGLAFRPDGKLLACTRRGDVWLVENSDSLDESSVTFKPFARGLHEALGMYVEDDNSVLVVQRPELTRLTDSDGDLVADRFVTICDKWGVSGDYHEFAFGPARDRDGNSFIALNVGFGGGHQAKGDWRGWCMKVTPDGEMEPWATGLRSPNGIAISPDGALFYCDNQGEWVATNKMHEIRRGEFYGHQAGLRFLKFSPFAKELSPAPEHGMRYDGADGKFPELTPPVIWFPYGRMGQSVSEPIWDTTGGKFGPFAGQCIVGDQTRSMLMRVALEKVGGRYQGACFPFRSGFQCGINRLAFGPDGSLYVGETNRGWGSLGGKPYGLERLVYTGELPFEIETVSLTRTGFDLRFTMPINPDTVSRPDVFGIQSWTYLYSQQYGYPETDTRGHVVGAVRVSDDRMSLSIDVDGLRRGRVYELRLEAAKSESGEALLHPEAFYTLNHLRE